MGRTVDVFHLIHHGPENSTNQAVAFSAKRFRSRAASFAVNSGRVDWLAGSSKPGP